jgi:hypothetical protein
MLTYTVPTRLYGGVRTVRKQPVATPLQNLRHSRFAIIDRLRKDLRQRHRGTSQSCRTHNKRVAYTHAYACSNVHTILLPVMETIRYLRLLVDTHLYDFIPTTI